MAISADLVHETTITTGTGNLTLVAVNGKVRFTTIFSTGGTNVFWYYLSNRSAAEWEYGIGHMNASNVLVRDTVVLSSNANALVSFTAGTIDAVSDIPYSLQAKIIATRETLTANRIYYVRTDGSDSNTGLVDSAGGAFLTIQKAVDTIAALDMGIFTATAQVRDGTYTATVTLKSFQGAAGNAIIQGNATTPANMLLTVTSGNCFTNDAGGTWTIKDMKLSTVTAGFAMYCQGGGNINCTNVDFGTIAQYALFAKPGSTIAATVSLTVSGNMQYFCAANGYIKLDGITITYLNSPVFSLANILAGRGAVVDIFGTTFVNGGTVTGPRYLASSNGVIFTNGAAATYIPGSIAGSTASGGQYT